MQINSLPLLLSCLLLTAALCPASAATNPPAETFNISKLAVISKPGCPSKCGNLTVPYPFGIGSGCALNQWFVLNCTAVAAAMGPLQTQAFLQGVSTAYLPGNRSLQAFEISDARLRVSSTVLMSICYGVEGEVNSTGATAFSPFGGPLRGSPYSYSDLNKLTVIGCDDSGSLSGGSPANLSISSNCYSSCSSREDVVGGACSGIGCCQSPLLKGQDMYDGFLWTDNNHSGVLPFNPCGYMFVGEQQRFVFRGVADLSDPDLMERVRITVPVVLDWWIGRSSCTRAENSGEYACKDNTRCLDSDTGIGGYRCSCSDGYEGNPYLHPGCTDIDECQDESLHDCEKICTNTPGGFDCACPIGQIGDGRKNGKGCNPNISKFPRIKVALGCVFGLLSLVMAATCLHYSIKKRKLLNQRQKYFQLNGGLLLQQQLLSKEGSTESIKLFTALELQQATNDYADDRILGKGGYGTVYKGILPDKSVVAVKKSRGIDGSQIEQFINEIIILTQINHRNVVTFIGCCLESKVPLLVFEYIPKGTLFEHIQRKSNWLSWESRLKIASEAAGALSYLHSSASTPIIHRDVKSANILLDEDYTAKISDFGASRLIPLDQTRVTTMVIGTFGYLDPEYFRTSHLTEKSDVYSFGVVLVELLTGGIALDMEMSEDQRNLATNFMNSMNENRLFQILEPRVVKEGSLQQLHAIAKLIERCCLLNREERPTMREVAAELEVLRKNSGSHKSVGKEDEAECLGSVDLYGASTSPYNSTQEFAPLYSWSSSTTNEV